MRLYYVCTAPHCGHRWTEWRRGSLIPALGSPDQGTGIGPGPGPALLAFVKQKKLLSISNGWKGLLKNCHVRIRCSCVGLTVNSTFEKGRGFFLFCVLFPSENSLSTEVYTFCMCTVDILLTVLLLIFLETWKGIKTSEKKKYVVLILRLAYLSYWHQCGLINSSVLMLGRVFFPKQRMCRLCNAMHIHLV